MMKGKKRPASSRRPHLCVGSVFVVLTVVVVNAGFFSIHRNWSWNRGARGQDAHRSKNNTAANRARNFVPHDSVLEVNRETHNSVLEGDREIRPEIAPTITNAALSSRWRGPSSSFGGDAEKAPDAAASGSSPRELALTHNSDLGGDREIRPEIAPTITNAAPSSRWRGQISLLEPQKIRTLKRVDSLFGEFDALEEVSLDGLRIVETNRWGHISRTSKSPDAWIHNHRPSCERRELAIKLKFGQNQCPLQSKGTQWFGACRATALLECKKELNRLFRGETFMAQTFVLSEAWRDFEEVAHKEPQSTWFLKSQEHGHAKVSTALKILEELKLKPKGGLAPFILQRKLENPWTFRGRATSARVYVVVTSHSPLRAYVLPSLHFLLTPARTGKGSDKCSQISNLMNNECDVQSRVMLVWRPTDSNHIAKHPKSFVSHESKIFYQDVELPGKLWRNILHVVRKVLVRVDAQSAEINRCKNAPKASNWWGPQAQVDLGDESSTSPTRCTTLFGIDVFAHADLSVSLLEVNALPTLEGGIGHIKGLVTDWLRLIGGAPTNRTAYRDVFQQAVQKLCESKECGQDVRTALLELADERWGRGMKTLQPLFPTSRIDPALQIEKHLSAKGLAITQLSSELLKLMHVNDDGDMAHQVRFKPELGVFLPSNHQRVIFGIGTEDATHVHLPLLRKVLAALPAGANIRTFAIAGSGDQFLTVYRELLEQVIGAGAEMTVADNSPRQVELAAVKLAALQAMPLPTLLPFLLNLAEEEAEAVSKRKEQLRGLLGPAEKMVGFLDRGYWEGEEVMKAVEAEGLFGVDASTKFWANNIGVYRTACASLSKPPPLSQGNAELLAHIVADPVVRPVCLLNALSVLPYMHSGTAASGWPLLREVGRGWLAVCAAHPHSWFCLSRLREPLHPAASLPTWLGRDRPTPPSVQATGSVRVHFKSGDVLEELGQEADDSLALIDLTNLPSALPAETFGQVLQVVKRKLHAEGVAVCFIGPLLSGGVCHATGGDLDRCYALVLELGANAGLRPRQDWPSRQVGESFAEFVVPFQHASHGQS